MKTIRMRRRVADPQCELRGCISCTKSSSLFSGPSKRVQAHCATKSSIDLVCAVTRDSGGAVAEFQEDSRRGQTERCVEERRGVVVVVAATQKGLLPLVSDK